jgi:hypothetical protein
VIRFGAVIYLAVLVGTGAFSPAELQAVKAVLTEPVTAMIARREKASLRLLNHKHPQMRFISGR